MENAEIAGRTDLGPMHDSLPGAGGVPAPEFPVQTLRHVYLTPFGGFSPDLVEGELGLSAGALARTELRPDDLVTIGKVDARARIPFILKQLFRVVPIDAAMRDAWAKAWRGEAVLPHEQPGAVADSARLDLARGDELLINGVLARRLGLRAS